MLFDVFSILLAFGIQTNGRRRKEIIHFSKIALTLGLFLFIVLSVATKSFWIVTYILEMVVVFAASNLIFSVLFRHIHKPD